MFFLDTNIFLRFLLVDDSTQHEEAVRIFTQAAKEEIAVCTSLVVMFELFWVLSSNYNKSKSDVVKILRAVLELEFIALPERNNLENALVLYKRSKVEFEDCYNLVYARARGVIGFKTFDKKLAKVVALELSS